MEKLSCTRSTSNCICSLSIKHVAPASQLLVHSSILHHLFNSLTMWKNCFSLWISTLQLCQCPSRTWAIRSLRSERLCVWMITSLSRCPNSGIQYIVTDTRRSMRLPTYCKSFKMQLHLASWHFHIPPLACRLVTTSQWKAMSCQTSELSFRVIPFSALLHSCH